MDAEVGIMGFEDGQRGPQPKNLGTRRHWEQS